MKLEVALILAAGLLVPTLGQAQTTVASIQSATTLYENAYADLTFDLAANCDVQLQSAFCASDLVRPYVFVGN